jgi:hypothetical protein
MGVRSEILLLAALLVVVLALTPSIEGLTLSSLLP